MVPSAVTLRRSFQPFNSRAVEMPPTCPSLTCVTVPRVNTPAPPTPDSSHISLQGDQQYSGDLRSSSWLVEGPSRVVPVRLFLTEQPATTEVPPGSSDPIPTSLTTSKPVKHTTSELVQRGQVLFLALCMVNLSQSVSGTDYL
jgi:hypothetical protein